MRKIFDRAAQLVSLTDITNFLNADGLQTKERVLERRDGTSETIGGRVFRSDGLRLIIRNPIYRGAVKFEGLEFAAKHEALVPPRSVGEVKRCGCAYERTAGSYGLFAAISASKAQAVFVPKKFSQPSCRRSPIRKKGSQSEANRELV